MHPSCTLILIKYFSKYPLKGVRKIDCLRWARVYGYNQQQRVISDKAAAKLARLVNSLSESHCLPCLEQYASFFSNEEIEIFNQASFNQRSLYYQKKFSN